MDLATCGLGSWWINAMVDQLQHGPSGTAGHHGPVTFGGNMARTIAGNTHIVF